jgi:hypothetical protein
MRCGIAGAGEETRAMGGRGAEEGGREGGGTLLGVVASVCEGVGGSELEWPSVRNEEGMILGSTSGRGLVESITGAPGHLMVMQGGGVLRGSRSRRQMRWGGWVGIGEGLVRSW